MTGNTDIGLANENKSAWSSFAPTNAAVPIRPSAPGRFSTTTGCFQRSASRTAYIRAATSVELPAPTGTIMRIARCGHGSAWSGDADAASPNREPANTSRQSLRARMAPSPFDDLWLLQRRPELLKATALFSDRRISESLWVKPRIGRAG